MVEFEASLVLEAADATQVLSAGPEDGEPSSTAAAVPSGPSGVEPSPAPQPAADNRWAGKTMGKFRLLRQLGAGTMGRVIQAEDTHLGRIVALKVLRREIAGMDGDTSVQQFLREARAAAQIDHPHVARVYEIDRHHGWWYIATEYLEGGSLRHLVKTTGPLAPARACPLIADAAAALGVAHLQGMVHRDVKPANLMLTRTGRAKLVDFGLVRLSDPNDPADFTHLAVGTPDYLAPEVARREVATPAADTYGLGATLFYLLVGHAPYRAKEVPDILKQHAEAPRPDLRDHVADCSDTLAELLQRMMAVDPADRPDMDGVATALRAETIGLNPEDTDLALLTADDGSTFMSAVGSAIGVERRGSQTGLSSRTFGASVALAADRHRRRLPWGWAATLVAGLVVVLTAAAWWWPGVAGPVDPFVDHARDASAFVARFPAAPGSYGARSVGARFDPRVAMVPAPDSAPSAIPFGWAATPGNVAAGRGWVADRDGHFFFGVDDPRAALIPADQAVFFATPDAAEQAGKTAYPSQ